jgi:hypothetical protein
MFHLIKSKFNANSKWKSRLTTKIKEKTMKSQKRWYWVGVLVAAFGVATAATLVKGDSSGGLIKFQADGTAAISSSGAGYTGTINGNEIGSAKITDNSYALSSLGVTGNGPDDCFLGGGVITITTQSGSSLNLVRSGIVCAISGTGITNGDTSNTVYMITGGTGRFAGASGGGNFTVTINNNIGLIHIDGNIQIAGG